MTRHDAGFLKDILRHYGRTNRTAERTGELWPGASRPDGRVLSGVVSGGGRDT